MSPTPRVTIGVAVYNGERYLAEAVDSLLAQDFEDIEVLLADNASTDGTPEICEQYAATDPRVRYLPSETNRGLAWNHNRVVHAAAGSYFKWAAYDDRYEPTFVSRCVEVLDERPDVVLAYTSTVDIDDRGEVVLKWDPTDRASAASPAERFRDVLLNERQCFPIYGLVRTSVLRATPLMGAFPSSDQPLLAELALHGRFHEIHEPLFLHREHPDRSMTRYPRAQDRMVFYDPSRAGAITLPRWRLLAEFARAVGRAPISRGERLRAWASLPAWANMWRMALAANVARAGIEIARRGVAAGRRLAP